MRGNTRAGRVSLAAIAELSWFDPAVVQDTRTRLRARAPEPDCPPADFVPTIDGYPGGNGAGA
ncbi:hypothetical protein MSZK_19490 [Mycobacterium sp. shizuoka-1]|nr:hypothetical protein MSZK_19490 [Mycobacterium sp. shizuoka-1]